MIGQRGERAGAPLVAQLGRPLEQPAVEVEDVARVGLAARRAAQQQRQLAVGLGLLGQVVVDDEGVLAVVHPVLAHGAAGVGGEVLERRRVGRRGDHHDRVVHGAVVLEGGHRLGDRRGLLADGDVDALHAQAALVEDRVDGDAGLARLAVADDQLALAPADRVMASMALMPVWSGSCTGLRPVMPGAWTSRRRGSDVGDRALAVDRLAEGVDHPAEQARRRRAPRGCRRWP